MLTWQIAERTGMKGKTVTIRKISVGICVHCIAFGYKWRYNVNKIIMQTYLSDRAFRGRRMLCQGQSGN